MSLCARCGAARAVPGALAAAAPPDQDGHPGDGEYGCPGSELDLGAGRLVQYAGHGAPDDVARADAPGERVNGPGEVFPGALDLLDERVRVTQRDLTIRFRHYKHPFVPQCLDG